MKNKKKVIVRVRTIVVTFMVVVALALYLLVQSFFRENINYIDFIILTVVTIVMHLVYFPDGEMKGQTNERFINNKNDYNRKATLINSKKQIKNLTQYCKVDFVERKQDYVETHCGSIELDTDYLRYIQKTYSIKEIKKSEFIYLDAKLENKYMLSKHRRKVLIHLCYGNLPIGYNYANTILSAKETDSSKAIQDESKRFKALSYVSKILTAIIIGLVMAYIGFTSKDGFGVAEACRMVLYIASIISTAVLSYSSGERSITQFKNDFYIELSTFIDRFFEWLQTEKKINIETYNIENFVVSELKEETIKEEEENEKKEP